jgi:hypothetical protein
MNHYCVCVIKFQRDGKLIQAFDPFLTFPNAGYGDSIAVELCKTRAKNLEKLLDLEFGYDIRKLLSIPEGVSVTIEPMAVKGL